jgi:ribosome-binding factor A
VSTRTTYLIGSAMVLALASGAFIVRDQMSQLDDDIVRAHYQKNVNALRMFDARALCGMLDPRYKGVDTSRVGKRIDRMELDRAKTCKGLKESMSVMRELVKDTKAEPEMQYVIESVEVSPDGKQAKVRMRMSVRIGERLSAASKGTETLIRRMGKVLVVRSETQTTMSVR